MTYEVITCEYLYTKYEIEADDEAEAVDKVYSGDYDGEILTSFPSQVEIEEVKEVKYPVYST